MPLLKAEVAGEPVRIFHLPPARLVDRFYQFTRTDSVFGLDVETTAIDEDMGPFDPDMQLRTVQFGNTVEAWVLDATDPEWRANIRELLGWEDKRFVSHTNYDPLWVQREFDIRLGARSIDTLPMAKLLFPSDRGGNDLKFLTGELIDPELQNAEDALLARFRELAPVGHRAKGKVLKAWGFTNIPISDRAFGLYGGLDAIYVRRLLDILAELLTERKLNKLSKKEQRIARMSTDMQVRGMRLDRDYTNSVLKEIDDIYQEADAFLVDAFGLGPKGPRSPRRGPWLQEKGVEFNDFSEKTGAPTLDKDALEDLAPRYASDPELGPIFANMVTLSAQSNLRSNLLKMLAAADEWGFVHPRINTQAAVTGRMSVVNPAMQTFKKNDGRLRGCFIAREGFSLVGADYDSQEIRIAAAFSRDEALLRIVNEGLNQHDLTATMLFGPKFTPEQRDIAKALNFIQQYGGGPVKIGDRLGYPRGPINPKTGRPTADPKAYKLWEQWREAYAGLVEWTGHMSNRSLVVNPYGRQIPADRKRRYANGNYMVQSSGRDVLGEAMIALEDKGWGPSIWLPMHDELILEVPEEKAEKAKRILTKYMFTEFGDIPLTVTAKIMGGRWQASE